MTAKKPLRRCWGLPDGWFLEPVLRWWPDFQPAAETARHKRLRLNRLIGISASAVRDRALAEGKQWAQGYLGPLSAKGTPIDVYASKGKAVAGLRQLSARELKRSRKK